MLDAFPTCRADSVELDATDRGCLLVELRPDDDERPSLFFPYAAEKAHVRRRALMGDMSLRLPLEPRTLALQRLDAGEVVCFNVRIGAAPADWSDLRQLWVESVWHADRSRLPSYSAPETTPDPLEGFALDDRHRWYTDPDELAEIVRTAYVSYALLVATTAHLPPVAPERWRASPIHRVHRDLLLAIGHHAHRERQPWAWIEDTVVAAGRAVASMRAAGQYEATENGLPRWLDKGASGRLIAGPSHEELEKRAAAGQHVEADAASKWLYDAYPDPAITIEQYSRGAASNARAAAMEVALVVRDHPSVWHPRLVMGAIAAAVDAELAQYLEAMADRELLSLEGAGTTADARVARYIRRLRRGFVWQRVVNAVVASLIVGAAGGVAWAVVAGLLVGMFLPVEDPDAREQTPEGRARRLTQLLTECRRMTRWEQVPVAALVHQFAVAGAAGVGLPDAVWILLDDLSRRRLPVLHPYAVFEQSPRTVPAGGAPRVDFNHVGEG